MDVARILVVQEDAGAARDLRLVVQEHPVEFEFRPLSHLSAGETDLTAYSAVAASIECARPEILEAFRLEGRSGPPVFLFRGEPPLREVARWVLWTDLADNGGPTMERRLLSESLEYYSLASLYQQCLKIMTSQDEEKLLAQITDTFVRELGAEGCVIWLGSPSDPDEMMIASVRGVISIDREGSRFFLSQTEWAESIWKGEPFLAPSTAAGPSPHSRESAASLYVPLLFQEKAIGLVKLGERADRKPYSESDRYLARIIADYAASSVRTVDRLFRMERISLRDPETRAYSAAFLADYFEKERYKASRFRRPLSLIFLAIENFAFLMEQTRESLVIGALAGMVETIRKVLRDSDLIARVDPGRFCVVLPETDYFGSMMALRRLRKAVNDVGGFQFLGGEFALHPFFMSATYPRDGKDFRELSRLAEDKFLRQQKSPLHRMRLMEKSFWDAFDVLVGKSEYYEQLRKGEEVPYFTRIRRDLGRNGHFSLPREMFLRIVESVAQDVASGGDARGLVIAAGPRPEIFKQIFLSFGTEARPGRNIYILGQAGSTRFDAKNLMYMTADDDRLKEKEIILYLKENGAYAFFATGWQEEVCGFHTADEWLVEVMMEKVQEMYLLQGNF
jgi:diguanylate cyclase (GGDEF)-like protein